MLGNRDGAPVTACQGLAAAAFWGRTGRASGALPTQWEAVCQRLGSAGRFGGGEVWEAGEEARRATASGGQARLGGELASRRGALPEVLADAGLLLDIPERYTPEARRVPSAAEVAPGVDALLRLWDDGAWYDAQRRRCLAAAEAWRPEVLAPRYEDFFTHVARRAGA